MMQKEKVTNGLGNNQLLYFTSSSVLADNSGLLYISDSTGSPNLWWKNFKDGQEKQLTFQEEGYLKSYVYFDGCVEKGFGKASVSLDVQRKRAYYLQGREVHCVSVDGYDQVLCVLPSGQMTGFTHVSTDGKYLCVPTVDAEAFDVTGDLSKEIDRKVQRDHLSSYLRVIDTQSGQEVLAERVTDAWITHVQFRPDSYQILYNHEWCENSGIRRMWLFDGKEHRRLRTENEQRSRKDWTCHEMWQPDGRYIIYHGQYDQGLAYIGRVDITTGEIIEIPLDEEYVAYGHFTVRKTGRLVTDGYWREPGDEQGKKCGRWISVLEPKWEEKNIVWTPLCMHESSWNCQCAHPHPIFDEQEQFVYFTSDCDGKRDVYRVAVPK